MPLRNLISGDWEQIYLERFGRPYHRYPGARCDDLACGRSVPRRFRDGTVSQALHGLASQYRRNKVVHVGGRINCVWCNRQYVKRNSRHNFCDVGNGLCRSNFFTLQYKTRRYRLFDRLMGSQNGRMVPRSFDSEIRFPARIVNGG